MAYRRRKKRKPAQLHTYEVRYTLIGGEIVYENYRLRCRKLTPAMLRSNKPLVGEVAVQIANGKWGPYAPGALPHVEAYNPRTVHELIEKPVVVAQAAGEKKP